ncbi:MAG: methylmalonyl-CoA mutase family protein [Candidatus Delongbacteria bacterium]|nr:methylmalonyl-CoA mutase family protein [Candidatus Delongbacteria bacterium]
MNKKELRTSMDQWRENDLEPFIKKTPERLPEYLTASSVPVDNLYTPLDIDEEQYGAEIGFPGAYPFTRGVYPTMYRGRLWTMRQYAGFGTAEQSNQRYKYLLEQGQTGLSVAFDLPTQIGYDSDHSLSEGEVGKVGVAIDSLFDMEILFKDIPLDKVSTSMTINAPAAVLLAMYIAVAEKQGIPRKQLRGTIQNDILKEYIARGTYIFPPKPSMRLIVDTFNFCANEMPKWNTISISGYHIREAGSTAVQEVAFTLDDGIEYCRAAQQAGMDIDRFAPQLSFFFNAHNDLLEEVAKFRAARRLWAKIIQNRFDAKDPKSMMLRFHTQTAGSTLTAQQPDNNIMRVTIQALAAVLGGTQSLHTNSRDEALALPTESSVQIALRTQQIIGYESGVTNTVDPLAGSYFIESMTDRIEREAAGYIEQIEAMGGMVGAIEKGYIQKEIQHSAFTYQQQIEKGQRVIVGVNKFAVSEEPPKDLLKVDPALREVQIGKIRQVKAGRHEDQVQAALGKIKAAAAGSENLVPFFIDAVKAYATLGEICDTLRGVFGEYEQQVFF